MITSKFCANLGKVHAVDADDNENAKVFYYVIRGNENNLFSIDRRDGSVYTLVSLDREQNNSYEFFVKATNNANYNSAPVMRMFLYYCSVL